MQGRWSLGGETGEFNRYSSRSLSKKIHSGKRSKKES